MISRHWFRQWLGWANVDPNLCHHIVSLCHNDVFAHMCQWNVITVLGSINDGMAPVWWINCVKKTICHDPWKFVLSCKQLRQTRKIYQELPYSVDCKAPDELWNPMNKTLLRKCSFIWYKGLVNILNYHTHDTAQNNLSVRPVNIFS